LLCLSPPQKVRKTEPVDVPMGEQLTSSQQQDLRELFGQFRDVFSTEPGYTDLIQHNIITDAGKKVKLRPYRVPEARREAISAEVQKMLTAEIIEPSYSE